MTPSSAPRPGRPWYLSIALYALVLIGISNLSSGCNDVDYLRGSRALPDTIDKTLAESPSSFIRSGMLREKARLEAMAEHHNVAFPLSLGRVFVALVLLGAAGSCFTRRRWAKQLSLQALGAMGLLALLSFKMLSPVHERMARAMAQDAVEMLPPAASTVRDREQSVDDYQKAFLSLDGWRFVLFECGTLLGIAIALTRPASQPFLREEDDDEQSPPPSNDESPPEETDAS